MNSSGTGDSGEYTGSSVDYYKVEVKHPTTAEAPYSAECNDIIEALGMNWQEANIFKAVWRRAAARNHGKRKAGYDNGLYDAEKIVFYGQRLVVLHEDYESPKERLYRRIEDCKPMKELEDETPNNRS